VPDPKKDTKRAAGTSKRPARGRARARTPSDAPVVVSGSALHALEAWLLSEAGDSEASAAFRAMPAPLRRRELRAFAERMLTEERRKLDAQLRDAERRSAKAKRDWFQASWRAAEAHLEMLRLWQEERLDRAKPEVDRLTPDSTQEEVARVRALMAEIEEARKLEVELELAMTEAIAATSKLTSALDRWEKAERWAMVERLAAAFKAHADNDAELRPIAEGLRVTLAELRDAIGKHEGTRAALGPVKGAASVIAQLTGVHERTVLRQQPALGKEFFRAQAAMGPAPEPPLGLLAGSLARVLAAPSRQK
jgi:hypothetical protein